MIQSVNFSDGFRAERIFAEDLATSGVSILKKTFLLSTAALLALCINVSATSVEAKGRLGRGAYLVPPPPAYAPSILPSLNRAHGTIAYSREVVTEEANAEQAEAKPVYVRTYNNTSMIKPLASRGGVTTYK
jgi:hypothetical protein